PAPAPPASSVPWWSWFPASFLLGSFVVGGIGRPRSQTLHRPKRESRARTEVYIRGTASCRVAVSAGSGSWTHTFGGKGGPRALARDDRLPQKEAVAGYEAHEVDARRDGTSVVPA